MLLAVNSSTVSFEFAFIFSCQNFEFFFIFCLFCDLYLITVIDLCNEYICV